VGRRSVKIAGVAFVCGTALGAALVLGWRDGSGDELEQLNTQLSATKVALAMEVQRSAARDRARLKDRQAIDSLNDAIDARDDSIGKLLEREPEVITAWRTPPAGGPAVPVPMVALSTHNELREACGILRLDCAAQRARLLALAHDDSVELRKRAAAIADLQTRIDTLPIPREPGRWSLAVAGPITLSFQNAPDRPPIEQRYGICGPVAFRFR
jgi:hypothetical protein